MVDFTDPAVRIERLLAQAEPRLRAAFLRMVSAIKSQYTLSEIATFVEAGSLAQALDTALRSVSILGEAYVDEFITAAREAASYLGRSVADIQIVFDQTNTRAVEAMRRNQLRLVRGFTEQQRETVRQILFDGVQRGLNPREIARQFRDSIGLTPNQMRAVENYRRALSELSPDALRRALRDKRFDRTVLNAIDRGQSLTAAQIDKMVGRYHEKMLAHRAEVIARTESLRAVNQGTEALFQQGIDEGTLQADNMERIWNTASDDRVRDSHEPMNGQSQPFGVAFQSGAGNALMYPGDPDAPAEETIQCRCVVATRIKSLIPEIIG